MSRRLLAATLVSSLLLAGCGAQKGGLVAAPTLKKAPSAGVVSNHAAGIVANNAARLAPTVGVIRGEAPVPTKAGLVSTLRVLSRAQMGDAELKADAESQGFSLFATEAGAIKPFTGTGFVRKTDAGFALEADKGGLFQEKTPDDHALVAGTTAISNQLVNRLNQKTTVKGVIDDANVVTVTAVSGALDLGFLTNWFTKGKIYGVVTNAATKKALAGATVVCKSEEGFLFKATSDADGEYTIKTLNPGKFTISVSKEGFQGVDSPADDPEVVGKREKIEYGADLAPIE
jgi:hypothetical protein